MVDSLAAIAQTNAVTINTLFQVLWGLVIRKICQSDDIVFGSVVSDCPPEIEGIEGMVRLFINIIPVRITLRDGDDFPQLLKVTQENSILSKPYEFIHLSQIDEELNDSRSIENIDSVMFFENFPIEEETRNAGNQGKLDFQVERRVGAR
jgi:non-ribosomal peptide synthetase component F